MLWQAAAISQQQMKTLADKQNKKRRKVGCESQQRKLSTQTLKCGLIQQASFNHFNYLQILFLVT